MAAMLPIGPFGAEPIEEIDLAAAPLVRVIAQVRFPRLAVLEDPGIMRSFSSLVATEYPFFEEGREISFLVNVEGVAQQRQKTPMWRFFGSDQTWIVSIAPTFLALETSRYVGRKDFVERFAKVVSIFSDITNVPFLERIGIRYTNRVDEPSVVENIQDYIEHNALGGLAIPLVPGVERGHAICDALFHTAEASIQVRWGLLPAGTVLDPTLPPVPRKNWVLDLDSFMQRQSEFSSQYITERTQELAEQAYRMFRWIVSERFIEAFRGGA